MATLSPYLNNDCVPKCNESDSATLISTSKDLVVCAVSNERVDITQHVALLDPGANKGGAAALSVTADSTQTNNLVEITATKDNVTALNVTAGNVVVAGTLNANAGMLNNNVVTLASGANVLTIAQSGTLFLADAVATYVATLPACTAAAVGVYYTFVISAATVTSLTIASNVGNENIVGALVLSKADGAPANTNNQTSICWSGVAGEDNIVIAAAEQGHGIGGRIKIECIEAVSGATFCWLISGTLNTVAGTPTVAPLFT
jgi:hypothetical protein